MTRNLEHLRDEIDRIDEQIVRLFDQRARCASAIGRLKREAGTQVYEPAREAFVLTHVKSVNAGLDGPLDAEAIGRLYERVMDEARRIQRLERQRAEGPAHLRQGSDAQAATSTNDTDHGEE